MVLNELQNHMQPGIEGKDWMLCIDRCGRVGTPRLLTENTILPPVRSDRADAPLLLTLCSLRRPQWENPMCGPSNHVMYTVSSPHTQLYLHENDSLLAAILIHNEQLFILEYWTIYMCFTPPILFKLLFLFRFWFLLSSVNCVLWRVLNVCLLWADF